MNLQDVMFDASDVVKKREARTPPELRSEVEVVDVGLGEHRRRAEQDFRAVDDGEITELACLYRCRAPGAGVPSATARSTCAAA
jgi:hypothetical protein